MGNDEIAKSVAERLAFVVSYFLPFLGRVPVTLLIEDIPREGFRSGRQCSWNIEGLRRRSSIEYYSFIYSSIRNGKSFRDKIQISSLMERFDKQKNTSGARSFRH